MTPWRCAGFCRGSAFRFFGRQRIGAMADRRHHGEGEHHQGDVAMPPMPGSALVVIEPELVFRGLKTVLDRPPMAFDRHQCFDGCSRWTPGAEEGEITIGDISKPTTGRLSTLATCASSPICCSNTASTSRTDYLLKEGGWRGRTRQPIASIVNRQNWVHYQSETTQLA